MRIGNGRTAIAAIEIEKLDDRDLGVLGPDRNSTRAVDRIRLFLENALGMGELFILLGLLERLPHHFGIGQDVITNGRIECIAIELELFGRDRTAHCKKRSRDDRCSQP